MSSGRDAFLQRVRQAVAEGNRAGGAPPLPERGSVGYQGAGENPIGRFQEELSSAGGVLHRVGDVEAAAAKVLELVADRSARNVLLGRGPVIDRLGLADRLRVAGTQVVMADALPGGGERDALFAADLGISGVAYLVAETGSVIVASRDDEPRSLTLLPPVHIAVADRSQLLPDLFDLLPLFSQMPSCLTVVSGPSKTGDIELRLVTGVHGPGEVHVVLMEGQALA